MCRPVASPCPGVFPSPSSLRPTRTRTLGIRCDDGVFFGCALLFADPVFVTAAHTATNGILGVTACACCPGGVEGL